MLVRDGASVLLLRLLLIVGPVLFRPACFRDTRVGRLPNSYPTYVG
jgi:hypothetical protein